mmetsp:Transcript_13375/g.16017  ORF Transcript_13375/g.16017 Transcript_13375/m.16017 type:complete len:96 (+) Transcript_13375:827-1114(+)
MVREHVARISIPSETLQSGLYCLKLEVVADAGANEFMRGWSFEGIGVTCRRNTHTQIVTEVSTTIITDITQISILEIRRQRKRQKSIIIRPDPVP